MPASLGKEERQGLIRRFLSGLKFPQLFLLLLGLFTIDLITPEPILCVDEASLGVLGVMLGMWRNRADRPEDAPPMKNITPKKESDLG